MGVTRNACLCQAGRLQMVKPESLGGAEADATAGGGPEDQEAPSWAFRGEHGGGKSRWRQIMEPGG